MYSSSNSQPPVIINDRSSEGLADANIRLGKCMYCGTNVPFAPSFGNKEEG